MLGIVCKGFYKGGRSIKVEPESFAEANSRSSGSELINRIKNGPDYPFLGLKYVTEYLNPGNPNKDPMYTCSLEGNAKTIMNSYLLEIDFGHINK